MGAEKPRPRILVVEDDKDLLRMIYRLLSQVADVAMATDGEHAMQLLRQDATPQICW